MELSMFLFYYDVYCVSSYRIRGLKVKTAVYQIQVIAVPSALLFPPQGPLADIKNFRNFTRAGLFISRFYSKARELQNCDKIP